MLLSGTAVNVSLGDPALTSRQLNVRVSRQRWKIDLFVVRLDGRPREKVWLEPELISSVTGRERAKQVAGLRSTAPAVQRLR